MIDSVSCLLFPLVCAASVSEIGFEKNKQFAAVWKFEWCLYNIKLCLCFQLVNIKLGWSELLCSWEIVNWHFERKECFSTASSMQISHWSQNCGVFCCATPINNNYYNIYSCMPMVAMSTVKVEWIILFTKIVNLYFESKESFLAH